MPESIVFARGGQFGEGARLVVVTTGFSLHALFETVGLCTGKLEDVRLVRQAVQQGRCQTFVAEDLRPIGKAQVGRDDQRYLLVERRAELKDRNTAKLVIDLT